MTNPEASTVSTAEFLGIPKMMFAVGFMLTGVLAGSALSNEAQVDRLQAAAETSTYPDPVVTELVEDSSKAADRQRGLAFAIGTLTATGYIMRRSKYI